jgi:A/G-specific adenine glycosylase
MKSDSLTEELRGHLLLQDGYLTTFRDYLLLWGRKNFQQFPWRDTRDPYEILVAEIMLHRTQVKQVVPIYIDFIKRFPDIVSVHQADESSIFASIKGLGLNWRARLFKEMADDICKNYLSTIPQEKEALVSLPGVNDYIASAVRSFAWGYPDPVMDTNTVRIIGRLFGFEIKDSSRRNPRFHLLIEKLVDIKDSASFNYAMLDLAHLLCHRKSKPECENCPIGAFCYYKIQ